MAQPPPCSTRPRSCQARIASTPAPATTVTTGWLITSATDSTFNAQNANRPTGRATKPVYRRGQVFHLSKSRTADKANLSFWAATLLQQVFLGDGAFAQSMLAKATSGQLAQSEVPRAQRRVDRSSALEECLSQHATVADALAAAYREGGLTKSAMARAMGISVPTVRRVEKVRNESSKTRPQRPGVRSCRLP